MILCRITSEINPSDPTQHSVVRNTGFEKGRGGEENTLNENLWHRCAFLSKKSASMEFWSCLACSISIKGNHKKMFGQFLAFALNKEGGPDPIPTFSLKFYQEMNIHPCNHRYFTAIMKNQGGDLVFLFFRQLNTALQCPLQLTWTLWLGHAKDFEGALWSHFDWYDTLPVHNLAMQLDQCCAHFCPLLPYFARPYLI